MGMRILRVGLSLFCSNSNDGKSKLLFYNTFHTSATKYMFIGEVRSLLVTWSGL